MRDLGDAQHEAAHVVVGVAMGLRLWRVTLVPEVRGGSTWLGTTEWYQPMPREADLLMMAAGVAWERRVGDLDHAAGDLSILRRMGVRGPRAPGRLRALERAAWAVLMSRAGLHARVTRALLERDLTGRDVAKLARGERLAE